MEFDKRTLQEPYARTSHYNVAEMEPLTLGLSSTHISGKSMLRLGTRKDFCCSGEELGAGSFLINHQRVDLLHRTFTNVVVVL